MKTTDLTARLWGLSNHEHDDLSIGAEAAAEIERLRGVLEECEEYFDGRADISDETHDDGRPYPNKEMTMLTMVRDVLDR